MSPQSRAANSAESKLESPEDLKETLASVGVHLKPSQLKTDAKELLSLVCLHSFASELSALGIVEDVTPKSRSKFCRV
jgi:hypothetical protein